MQHATAKQARLVELGKATQITKGALLGHAPPPLANGLDMRGGHPAD